MEEEKTEMNVTATSEYDNVVQNLKSELVFEKRKYDVCISSLNKSLLDYSKLQDYLNETISKNEELVRILEKREDLIFKKNSTIAELENKISDIEEQSKKEKNEYESIIYILEGKIKTKNSDYDLLQSEKNEYESAYNNLQSDVRVLNEQNVELLTKINTAKNAEISTSSSTNTDYHKLIDDQDRHYVKKCCIVC